MPQQLPGAVTPGEASRKVARWGAALLTAAMLIPVNGSLFISKLGMAIEIAWGSQRDEGLISFFCCFAAPAFLGGPVFWLACNASESAPALRKKSWRIFCLWVVSALTPYVFAFKQMPARTRDNDTVIALEISGLSLYLLANALCYLRSRRDRGTPLEMFGAGLPPAILSALAWIALAVAYIQEIVRARHWEAPISCVVVLGLVGSGMLLYGWIRWWRALASARLNVRAPMPAVPAVNDPQSV